MKKKIIIITACTIITIITIGIVGCSNSSPMSFELDYEELMKEKHVTWATSVNAGDKFEITLGSNPTTGFTWPNIAQIIDSDIVKQTNHEFISTDSNAVVGASGKDVWTFRALKKGTTTIQMNYSQSWDGGEKSEWSLVATITVR
ncbi:MAG: protease inhibitor I42 family protein [Dehalococcoidales bacterium]|nr:MAG: protease inhibitor I42 family protein [Dehalococcoidales bacterium]